MSSVENNFTFECSRPWIVDDEKAFTEYHVSGIIIASMRRDTGSRMVWNLFKMSEAVPQKRMPQLYFPVAAFSSAPNIIRFEMPVLEEFNNVLQLSPLAHIPP
jgi:hypothetical protein